MEINENDLLCRMIYLRSSLMFKGTAERAFENNWLNEEHSLNITKLDLIKLL